ncbi:MAG TPA: FAD:protein FMN transferase [Verrucomicrobiaceae bacterium]|jgi:thiamine biosynthesis lipoprotein
MGTTWHAIVVAPLHTTLTKNDMRQLLQHRLDELDLMITNWRDSPVTRFNASHIDDWQNVPRELMEMVRFARELSEKSDGAFDITISPLVDFWGFGPKGRVIEPPAAAEIAGAMKHVGWQQLEFREDPPALRKLDPEIKINVSAMADGYACDDLARRLRSRGWKNFLIEIGGAVIAAGTRADGNPWHAGIQRPFGAKGETVNAIELRDQAVSTSGVYRQSFDHHGTRYPHVLDARTGRPIMHHLVSVSVIHDSAFVADGWDTTLLILGPEEGRALAEKLHLDTMFLEER